MIKVLLFDFFDVLHRDAQKAWLEAHGLTLSGVFAETTELFDAGEIDMTEYFRRYADAGNQPYEDFVAEYQSYEQLDQELVDLIAQFKGTYKTGLLSNANADELRPILTRYDLGRLFDKICISSEVGMAKPAPEIFLHLAGLLGVTPGECVFTDDNPRNVAAAESVGMQGIVYTDVAAYHQQLQELQP